MFIFIQTIIMKIILEMKISFRNKYKNINIFAFAILFSFKKSYIEILKLENYFNFVFFFIFLISFLSILIKQMIFIKPKLHYMKNQYS